MKILFLAFTAVAMLGSFFPIPRSASTSVEPAVVYAYLPQDAVLYDGGGDKICTLPATYFVVIAGVESGGKYPVSYLDLFGFVSLNSIEIVDYEPVTKFPALTCKPDNDGLPVNLRSNPSTSRGEILAAVPPDTVLTLYGGVSGDEVFAGAGSEWKFVRYDAAQKSIYGYIYAPQLKCDAVTPNIIEKVEKKPSPGVSESDPKFTLGTVSVAVMAVALCVPAGIIMIAAMHRPDSSRVPRHASEK